MQNQVLPENQNPASIIDQFNQTNQKNESVEILKELFDNKKIFMITDISRDEAILLTRIYMASKLKNIDIWREGIMFFCETRLSIGRKSRTELLKAIQGAVAQNSFMSKLNPFNKFGSQGLR